MVGTRTVILTVIVVVIAATLVIAAYGGFFTVVPSTSSAGGSAANAMCPNAAQYNESVPLVYQPTYTALGQTLTSFGQTLNSTAPGPSHHVTYATELLPADSNLGTKLLTPQAMQGVVNYLNAIQKLGVRGVTIDISYPLLTPTFPNYAQYLRFYEEVVQQARERGMTIDIESQIPLLVGYPGISTGSLSYANVTYSTYVAQDRQMIQTIINTLHPDYCNIGTETDTLQMLLHYPEISTPQGWGSYISSLLNGLNKNTTKIAVGIGAWDPISYLYATLNDSAIDAIAVHVYPVYGNNLATLIQIGQLSRQYNKPIDIDEMWLHKSVANEGQGFAKDAQIRQRNVYAFWSPLDEQFLNEMSDFAHTYNVAYMSPFEGSYFFAYLNYNASTANVSYTHAMQMANQAASQNIASNTISPLGCYYQALIRRQTS